MSERLDYSHPVDTTPPAVDVVVVYHRERHHPWLLALLDSVQAQSYANVGVLLVDNSARNMSIGEARNQAIAESEAELVLFPAEEDMLTADAISAMVTFYQFALKSNAGLVHITTHITAIDERTTQRATIQHTHGGMYQRAHLVAHPFEALDYPQVDASAQRALQQRAIAESINITFAVAHHFGYIMRLHPFRADGINLKFPGR